jgi:hypothetical protein
MRWRPDWEAREYSRKSIRRQLRNADSFGRWLDHQKLPLAAITGEVVDRYIKGLHRSARDGYAKGYVPHNARGLPRLLDLLQSSGVLPPADPPGIPADSRLCDFDQYLDCRTRC